MITKQQIQAAIETRKPFRLRMNDGREYLVKNHDYIWLMPGTATVMVGDDKGSFTVLPLLSVSGLQSKVQSNGK